MPRLDRLSLHDWFVQPTRILTYPWNRVDKGDLRGGHFLFVPFFDPRSVLSKGGDVL